MEILRSILAPHDATELAVAYFFWVAGYFIAHIWWDYKSVHTPTFHWSELSSKGLSISGGRTLASSIFILSSLFYPETRKLVDVTLAPLIFAGGAGILQSMATLCPYRRQDISKNLITTPSVQNPND